MLISANNIVLKILNTVSHFHKILSFNIKHKLVIKFSPKWENKGRHAAHSSATYQHMHKGRKVIAGGLPEQMGIAMVSLVTPG